MSTILRISNILNESGAHRLISDLAEKMGVPEDDLETLATNLELFIEEEIDSLAIEDERSDEEKEHDDYMNHLMATDPRV